MREIIIALIGSGLLSAVVSGAFGMIQKGMDKKSGQNRLILSITRDRIKTICREKIVAGYITFDELEDLTEMHNAYHEAGGNGYCDELMAKVKTLQLRRN